VGTHSSILSMLVVSSFKLALYILFGSEQ
jgi:hypothetical protein